MILVMHCHADYRTALMRFLRLSGFDAAGFEAGSEGMTAMRRQRPRLLILNGTLADMQGIELLRMVRADEDLADLPVCFMSCDEERKLEAQRLGIAEYFLKPVDSEQLLVFVQRTLHPSPV